MNKLNKVQKILLMISAIITVLFIILVSTKDNSSEEYNKISKKMLNISNMVNPVNRNSDNHPISKKFQSERASLVNTVALTASNTYSLIAKSGLTENNSSKSGKVFLNYAKNIIKFVDKYSSSNYNHSNFIKNKKTYQDIEQYHKEMNKEYENLRLEFSEIRYLYGYGQGGDKENIQSLRNMIK